MSLTPDDLTVREISADECPQGSALYIALKIGEKVHAFGKGTPRNEAADLHDRMAKTEADKNRMSKRAFGLFVNGEAIPHYVIYASFARRPAREDGKVPPDEYPARMSDILLTGNQPIDEANPPNIAVCYSISTINELTKAEKEDLKKSGIERPGGGLLIKGVHEHCQSLGVPNVVTLSPMPGFEEWLKKKAEKEDTSMLDSRSWLWLASGSHKEARYDWPGFWKEYGLTDVISPIERLYQLFQDETYSRLEGPVLEMTNDILRKVGRYYLKEAEKQHRGLPTFFDDVQFFHQGNGALIGKITPQREKPEDTILVTHPEGQSLNKLNVSYRYGLEKNRHASPRPGTDKVEDGHQIYLGRLENVAKAKR